MRRASARHASQVEVQSAKLHGAISRSSFDRVLGMGHMIHQSVTEAVMAAIVEVVSHHGRLAMAKAA